MIPGDKFTVALHCPRCGGWSWDTVATSKKFHLKCELCSFVSRMFRREDMWEETQ